MTKIKVLRADEHAILRDGIHALRGVYDDIEIVGEAPDGNEAIKKTLEFAPDVLLADLVMPEMDGLEAIRRIRKRIPTVQALVLTQYEAKEYMLSAITAGVAGYTP